MTNKNPFLFEDFCLARDVLLSAFKSAVQYILLTGESGAGKSTLLAFIQDLLERCFFRIVYFHCAKLSAAGLVRVLATELRIAIRRTHSETIHAIASVLSEEPGVTLIWIDEAHTAPDDTFTLARTLVEADLSGQAHLSLLLTGLPVLRQHLHAPHLFPLWRRIQRRVEITGLKTKEARPFARHVLGEKTEQRISDKALAILFEHSRGLPGLLVNYLDLLVTEQPKGTIAPDTAQSLIQRWDLA